MEMTFYCTLEREEEELELLIQIYFQSYHLHVIYNDFFVAFKYETDMYYVIVGII